MHAGTFVTWWDVGQPVGGLDAEFLEYLGFVHVSRGCVGGAHSTRP